MKNLNWSLIKTGIAVFIIGLLTYLFIGIVIDLIPEKYVKDTLQVMLFFWIVRDIRKQYAKKEK